MPNGLNFLSNSKWMDFKLLLITCRLKTFQAIESPLAKGFISHVRLPELCYDSFSQALLIDISFRLREILYKILICYFLHKRSQFALIGCRATCPRLGAKRLSFVELPHLLALPYRSLGAQLVGVRDQEL